jgi:hypothetical protein
MARDRMWIDITSCLSLLVSVLRLWYGLAGTCRASTRRGAHAGNAIQRRGY